MMTCIQVRPILSLLIEKETGPLETLEARRHLDDCVRCRTRAAGLQKAMSACSALPSAEPPRDIGAGVMEKLRAMRDTMTARAQGAGLRAGLAARWSGLALMLGAVLATVTQPHSGARGAVGRSIDWLAALLYGSDAPGRSSDLAGGAALVAVRLMSGGLRPEVPAGAGVDLLVVLNLAATALLIGFLLALPVAALTAWFLRAETRRRELPHP